MYSEARRVWIQKANERTGNFGDGMNGVLERGLGRKRRFYSYYRYCAFIRQAEGRSVQKLITTPGQVGEILRGRRKARKLPQQELANKLQVSQSRLSTLESNPSGMTLDRLLVLLNLLDLELVLRDKAGVSSQVEW